MSQVHTMFDTDIEHIVSSKAYSTISNYIYILCCRRRRVVVKFLAALINSKHTFSGFDTGLVFCVRNYMALAIYASAPRRLHS